MTAGRSAGTEQGQGREDECPLSERVDGKLHSWVFDGDDPYVICHYCDQMQDAMTGRVIRDGRHVSPPVPPARDSGHQGDAASFRVTVRAGDPASADRLAHAAAELVVAEFGAHVQHDAATEPGPGLERDPDSATDVGARDPHWIKDHFELDGDNEPSGGRDEAREAAVDAIAQHMSADYDSQRAWIKGNDTYRESWRDEARELLGLPAVAALLRDGTTT